MDFTPEPPPLCSEIAIPPSQNLDPEEPLPDYTGPTVPTYEEPVIDLPTHSYIIHQTHRHLRTLMPDEFYPNLPSYIITGRRPIFSTKPVLTLRQLVTPTARRASIASTSSIDGTATVAQLRMVSHTSIPWHPRLSVTYVRNPINPVTYVFRALNFADFTVDIGARKYVWKLTDHPSTSLLLIERTGNPPGRIWARFAYSQWGTDASKGQEVGRLDIFDADEGDMPDGFAELAIGSCDLVVQYWKNMGKHFRNNVLPSRCSQMRLGGGTLAQGGFGSFAFAGFQA